MKVKDIISRMVDNYYPVTIEVYCEKTNLIKERYIIKPHSTNYTHIPPKVWESEVKMIVPFYSNLSICVY